MSGPAKVAGVLLAAGEGSRFGQPKALVVLDGLTLAERGVGLLRAGGADPVLVVTGAAPVAIPGTRTVHNEQYRTGMGSSLRVALATMSAWPATDAVVVALADQPLISPEAVARLIGAHRAGAGVAVAVYQGRPRNPVLLAREHWPQVIALATGDQGARAFLRSRPDLVTLVECGDTGRPDDIDTPADLERIAGQVRPELAGPGGAGGDGPGEAPGGSTGSPARRPARKPPSTSVARVKPSCCSVAAARLDW